MRRLIFAILAIAIIIAIYFAYITFGQTEPLASSTSSSSQNDTSNSSVSKTSQIAPPTSATDSSQAVTEAKAHIDRIKSEASDTIEVADADHFVSANQRIRIPQPTETSTNAADQDMMIIESLEPAGIGSAQTQGISDEVIVVNTSSASNNTDTSTQKSVIESTVDALKSVSEAITDGPRSTNEVIALETAPSRQVPTHTEATAEANSAEAAQGSAVSKYVENRENTIPSPSTHTITITVPSNNETNGNSQNDRMLLVSSTDQSGAISTSMSDTSDLEVIGIEQTENSNEFTLNELLDTPVSQDSDVVYFIHAVTKDDDQGLWGIVQKGLMKRFAQGIKLRSEKVLIQAEIPEYADERLADNSSSFLGYLLNNKVNDTFVYNYQEGRLGDDPNIIRPGQQLVIVRFEEQELIEVFNRFVAK